MFHLCGYYESTAGTANTDQQPIQDDVLVISNNHFLPQQDYDLIWAYAGSPLLDRMRIVSPTNRVITLPYIVPVNLDDSIPANPAVADYRDNPFRVRGLEELAVEATNTGAGPSDTYCLLALQSVFEPVPRGNIFTLRGTSTTTTAQGVWTSAAVAWADTLPEGTFAVVGGHCVAATAVAFRLIFEGQILRPGGLAMVLATGRTFDGQLKGGCGIWGRFKPTAMPTVQLLNNAAVASHTIYLDIMRVA